MYISIRVTDAWMRYIRTLSNQFTLVFLFFSLVYFFWAIYSSSTPPTLSNDSKALDLRGHLLFDTICSELPSLSESPELTQLFCGLEKERLLAPHAHNRTAVVRDTSRIRYFAQRDLPGWQIFYESLGFTVYEPLFELAPPDRGSYDVLLCMGLVLQDQSCVHPEDYPKLAVGQRVSQFYGMRQVLWRKDSFCRTMKSVFSRAPKHISSDFLFDCWVLPNDLGSMRETMQNDPNGLWIAKPRSRGEGKGIMIVRNLGDLYDNNLLGSVVQPYMDRVLLIEGRKFDLRTYVLVTSVSPLRAYFYKEGLVRLAPELYNKTGNAKTKILTNTSIGKLVADINDIVWMYRDLRKYLRKQGFDDERLFERVEEVIVKTLLAGEVGFQKLYQETFPGYMCENCFQLLGVDVIIDEDLNPKVIEVNGIPSMQLSHDLGVKPDTSKPYTATKFGLLKDTLNILYQPNIQPYRFQYLLERLKIGFSLPAHLCKEEHQLCLTQKELAFLVSSQREFAAKGQYKRIYPCSKGSVYTPFLKHTQRLIKRTAIDKNQLTTYKLHHLLTRIEIFNTQLNPST